RYSDDLALFKDRITTIPEAAEGLKQIAREKLAWLDQLIDGREYICGDKIRLADVLLYCFVSFGGQIGQPLPDGLDNVAAWQKRMSERPSANA
ncbi:MAG: glutathione S-transferase C-terminal domain-containing protein, partial [Gammaproteobacteria bacterium]|nr:glutathione S-transferase C-terminal domain-containing protein [Gammaproteobacteria bacterium]